MEPHFVRGAAVAFERFDDETVVLDHETGRTVRLNASASVVWSALDAARSPAEVAQDLVSCFGIEPDRAEEDATRTLEGLERRGLVTRVPDPPRP